MKAKNIILPIVSIAILTGCSSKYLEEEKSLYLGNPKYEDISLKVSKDTLKFKNSNSYYVFFYGPKIDISKEEYTLKAYAKENLLEKNYGIKGHMYSLINVGSNNYKNTKARALGFQDFNHMLIYLMDSFSSKSEYELFQTLTYLDENKMIDIKNINQRNIEIKQKEIINIIYSPLFKLSQENKISENWFCNVNGEKISFTEKDYLFAAKLIIIIEELLNSSGTKKVYGL